MRVWHGLREPAEHWSGGPSALWRREEERQWPSFGGGPDRDGDAQDVVDGQSWHRDQDGPGSDNRSAWGRQEIKGAAMWLFEDEVVPRIQTELPGPQARALLER